MIVNLGRLELEMESLARAKGIIVHRSPGLYESKNACSYYVCDQNDNLLFPRQYAGETTGATAEDTHRWLSVYDRGLHG